MASFNRVILCGNLTRDPELRETPGGAKVCEMGMAVNERYKNQSGEWVEKPVYVDFSAWNRQAETCSQYLSKGSPVLIEGRLRYDTWEKEGQKRSKLSVTADRVQFLGSPKQAGMGQNAGPGAAPSPAPAASGNTQPAPPPPSGDKVPGYEEEENDDLPF